MRRRAAARKASMAPTGTAITVMPAAMMKELRSASKKSSSVNTKS